MVFKMFSTGFHTRKMNGKLIKHDNYKLRVNPNNKGLVNLYTKQKDGNAYNNEFNNQEDFMKNFLANEKSLFKMNKNIGQQTKKRKPKKQKPKKQKPNSYYKTLFIKLQKKQKKQQKKQKQQTEKIKRQFKYLQRSLS
jgi:hypothetical protein